MSHSIPAIIEFKPMGPQETSLGLREKEMFTLPMGLG